ncbi:MAG: M12 family metallo-peptidase [Phycisphaerales bacterium]
MARPLRQLGPFLGTLVAMACAALAPAASMRMLADEQHDVRARDALGLSRADLALMQFDAAPGQALQLPIPLNGQQATLVLAPVSQRAPGFAVRVQGPGGTWRTADPGPVRTYEGVCPEAPGSRVAAFVHDGAITARIEVPGLPGAFWVEPASADVVGEHLRGEGQLHIGYHSLDRVADPERAAGASACETPLGRWSARHAEGDAPARSLCTASICVAEIACDSDYEFFQLYGSVEAVQAQIERVIAVMNLQFASEVGIRHRITTILVRTVPGAPYTAVQSQPLLFQFRDHWNLEHTAIARDVAKLFTGKALSAGVLGSAFIGSICNTPTAYAVVRSDCCGGMAGTTDLSAHELGHVWGAEHCLCSAPAPISTMNAVITFANTFVTDLSGASVASITAGRTAATCLEAETPVPPAGAFALALPPTETWGLTGPVSLTWNASANAAFYLVTIADDPAFTAPLLSAATLSPAYTVPGASLAPATRFHWKVEAWNDASVVTPTSSGSWTFLTAVPPSDCPGDFFPDNAVNTVDLTFLLGKFGQLVSPGANGDMNGDGRVTTQDLTAFLGRFGSTCP